jgi:hypothetical protein
MILFPVCLILFPPIARLFLLVARCQDNNDTVTEYPKLWQFIFVLKAVSTMMPTVVLQRQKYGKEYLFGLDSAGSLNLPNVRVVSRNFGLAGRGEFCCKA